MLSALLIAFPLQVAPMAKDINLTSLLRSPPALVESIGQSPFQEKGLSAQNFILINHD